MQKRFLISCHKFSSALLLSSLQVYLDAKNKLLAEQGCCRPYGLEYRCTLPHVRDLSNGIESTASLGSPRRVLRFRKLMGTKSAMNKEQGVQVKTKE